MAYLPYTAPLGDLSECTDGYTSAADGPGKAAVCKTVGSAYDGSNPSPATPCENAPLAANSRAGGAFPLCPGMCHLVALWTVMLRCPRTYSGRPPARLGRSVWAATTVGVRSCDGRCAPSAVSRTATDGPHQRQVPAGPAPLGRARGRFDYHSGGTWLRRRSSCPRCTGPIRGQQHGQVRLPPRLRRSGRGLGCGDCLSAFA
jgi:hypothetical protein